MRKQKIIKEFIKKYDDEKGITLAALIITVILLLLLAGVGITFGKDSIESARLMSYGTELISMQNKVNELEQELKQKEKSGDTEGANAIKNLGESWTGNAKASTAFSGAGETNTNGYRYYSEATVQSLGFDNFKQEFLVNVERRKVITLEGIKYKDKVIWTVEDLEGNEQFNVGYEGVTSNVAFNLGISDNKLLVNDISHTGNVKNARICWTCMEGQW